MSSKKVGVSEFKILEICEQVSREQYERKTFTLIKT